MTPAEVAAAPPEVRDHEPPLALVAGEDGNAVVARLAGEAARWLRPYGWLLVEVGEGRADDGAAAAERAGFRELGTLPDLTGATRFVVGRRGRGVGRG